MRMLEEINDAETARHIVAERSMLHRLRGHCNSPIAGHASTTPDGKVSLFGMVFNRDGSRCVRSHGWGRLMIRQASARGLPVIYSGKQHAG